MRSDRAQQIKCEPIGKPQNVKVYLGKTEQPNNRQQQTYVFTLSIIVSDIQTYIAIGNNGETFFGIAQLNAFKNPFSHCF